MSSEWLSTHRADTSESDRAVFLEAVRSASLPRIRSAARQLLATTRVPTRTSKFIRAQLEKQPPAGLQPYKIALLSSFSIELVETPLWIQGFLEGMDISIYRPGYDLYRQEILDTSSALYREAPDAVILAVDGPRWGSALYDGFLSEGWRGGDAVVQATLDAIAALVHKFREASEAPILFHSLVPPRFPQLGILDGWERNGQARLIRRVNYGLAELAGNIHGFYPIDIESVVRDVGYQRWHDPRLFHLARSPIARPAMEDLARTYARFLRALTGRTRKCLVLDMDNTLWGGILGEEGPLGVALGSEYPGSAFVAFQHALLTLRERGVLLAIASKNNPADVDELFDRNTSMVLKPEHFSAMQVHWEPKSRSLQRIADELGLGLEHLVFIDDNPAECAEVAYALPEVTSICLPSQPENYIETLFNDGLFDTLSLTQEDLQRAELYRKREQGERLRQAAGSIEDYWRSLDMAIYLSPVTGASLRRAAQMTQKTNQFNTTTRRYTETDIAKRMKADDWKTVTARVTDKFGDNGIVLLAMARLRNGVLDIETFLMSCRVLGRTIETAALHHLADIGRDAGVKSMEGWIFPTKRNAPVRNVYERHGFTLIEEGDDGSTRWRLDLGSAELVTGDWLRLIDKVEE